MKNIIKNISFAVLTLTTLLFAGCAQEPALTGQSTLEVSNGVAITLTTAFASPVTIMEGDQKYGFTVTLNKPQSVNVVVKIKQIGGTASSADYTVENELTIPAYKLSASGTITILKDALKENIETLILQFGDNTVSNASFTPVTATFNIQNYTEGSLVTDLSWETTIKDTKGDLITATDAADLKLLITKLDNTVLQTVDASKDKFESFEMLSTYADGTYLVVAKAVSFKNLGTLGNFDVDLTVKFNQTGVYNNTSFTFKKALNSAGLTSCGATGYFKLAQIKKSGTTYTISEVGQAAYTFDASIFNGPYKIAFDGDWQDYSTGDAIPVQYNAADGLATFRIMYTAAAGTPGAYIEVTFDRSTGNVTKAVGSVPFTYSPGGTAYTVSSGTGTVNFCTGAVNLLLTWKSGSSTYADQRFNIVK